MTADRRSLLLALVATALATVVVVATLVSRSSPEPVTPQEYRAELADVLDDLDVFELSGQDGLEQLAERFRAAEDRLGELEPPAAAAAAHDRLVAGLGSYGDRLAELSESGRAGAVQFELQLAEQQLAGEEWIEAFNELARKGYVSR